MNVATPRFKGGVITFRPHDSQLSSCHVSPFYTLDWLILTKQLMGHFDTCMQLTDPSLADIKWWHDSVHSAYILVQHNQPRNYMKEDHCSYRCNFCSYEKKARKKFRLLRDSNFWPLRYRCSALLIKQTSHLGAGRWIRSLPGLARKKTSSFSRGDGQRLFFNFIEGLREWVPWKRSERFWSTFIWCHMRWGIRCLVQWNLGERFVTRKRMFVASLSLFAISYCHIFPRSTVPRLTTAGNRAYTVLGLKR